MNKGKKIRNLLFLAVIFAVTLWSVFRGEDIREVVSYLKEAELLYIVPSFICVLGFILGEAVVICYLMRSLGTRICFSHCCMYSFIGFFYSCITPSASGGQPMQVVAMRKDRIPVAVSSVVLAIVTITYKMVLVLLGTAVVVVRPAAVMVYLEPVKEFIYLGLVLNVGCIAALLLLVFDPNAVLKLLKWADAAAGFFHLSVHSEKKAGRVEQIAAQYRGAAEYYRTHKGIMLRVFLLTLVQRCSLFLVTWFVYCSFGLSGHSMPVIVTLQAMISVASDMLPLPGGMGVSENLFLDIFYFVFGDELVLPGMILSRGISYYTQLLISAVMTVAASFIIKEKKAK